MTTTATPSWFLAAARIIVGPPMSMFSIATSGVDVVAGDGLLEGVEVDADQVDRLDPLALERRHVLGVVAARQQRRVQPRVQRLHPAAEDLLLAGELGDVGDLEPGLAQRRRGAAGGEDLDPERREALGEVGDPGLVGDRDQRPAHPDRAVARRSRARVSAAASLIDRRPCAGRSASILTLPAAIMRIASG